MEYTLTKLLAVNAVSFALVAAFLVAARQLKWGRRTEIALGIIAVAGWCYMQYWYVTRPDFKPTDDYPLHVCDFSAAFAALSLLLAWRPMKTLLYFTAPFAVMAFITPTTEAYPNETAFWLFWIGHACILGLMAYIVWIRGYRPARRDFQFAILVGTIYFLAMFGCNWAFDFNYAYVGKKGPPFPLGGWPWHGLVIYIIMLLVFLFLWKVGSRGEVKRSEDAGRSHRHKGS